MRKLGVNVARVNGSTWRLTFIRENPRRFSWPFPGISSTDTPVVREFHCYFIVAAFSSRLCEIGGERCD
jgi:hypothetical protein